MNHASHAHSWQAYQPAHTWFWVCKTSMIHSKSVNKEAIFEILFYVNICNQIWYTNVTYIVWKINSHIKWSRCYFDTRHFEELNVQWTSLYCNLKFCWWLYFTFVTKDSFKIGRRSGESSKQTIICLIFFYCNLIWLEIFVKIYQWLPCGRETRFT